MQPGFSPPSRVPGQPDLSEFRWLRTGDQALAEMLTAIDQARISVRLEMYIFYASPIAEKFREALVNAAQRGVRVQVIIDALGSITLPDSFWEQLRRSGGQFRWFNPLKLKRLGLRDHRKVLVCDEKIAFIGGFNISTEYQGDGVRSGWRDLGMNIRGDFVRHLAAAFDEMFAIADFKKSPLVNLGASPAPRQTIETPDGRLLLTGPGRQNPLKKHLRKDLAQAHRVQIICAYFLPSWRLRRSLSEVTFRGGNVELILAGKSDVPLSQLAARSLYRRLLQARIQVYEYQPQILHAKLILVDDIAYVGSANLDTRSLNINYELAVRLVQPELVAEAREIFQDVKHHCLRIQLKDWKESRSLWMKLKQRWAYFILARLDPFLTKQQLKMLR